MAPKINPHLFKPAYKRWKNLRAAGGKMYIPILSGPATFRTRLVFKRAGDAQAYASRLLARWIRLYNAAIVATAIEQPIKTIPQTMIQRLMQFIKDALKVLRGFRFVRN